MALRLLRFTNPIRALCQVRMSSSDSGWGSGVGKGGGAGGTVREAGGSFGKMEAAHEEQFFRKLQAEQLAKLHAHHVDEIHFLEKEVKEQEDEIARHKEKIAELKKMAMETEKH